MSATLRPRGGITSQRKKKRRAFRPEGQHVQRPGCRVFGERHGWAGQGRWPKDTRSGGVSGFGSPVSWPSPPGEEER